MTKRKISAMNAHIVNLAGKVTDAIVAETEEVLEDAETVVKEFVPARFVNKTLASIESKLEKEGVEVLFDKTVTRQALKTTASEEVTQEEIDELVEEIVSAIVAELEEVLEDADDAMDEETSKVASTEEDEDLEIETKLKSIVERKLNSKGIYSRFARKASVKKSKVSIADKIRAARRV